MNGPGSVLSVFGLRRCLPSPLPPLAEVQIAEEERLLDVWGKGEQVQYLGLRARVTPSWRAALLRKTGLTPRGTRLSPESPVVHFRCGPVTRSAFLVDEIERRLASVAQDAKKLVYRAMLLRALQDWREFGVLVFAERWLM